MERRWRNGTVGADQQGNRGWRAVKTAITAFLLALCLVIAHADSAQRAPDWGGLPSSGGPPSANLACFLAPRRTSAPLPPGVSGDIHCEMRPTPKPEPEKHTRYTVKEIDALRAAVRNRELWGAFDPHVPLCIAGKPCATAISRGYVEADLMLRVELMVRTYIEAGITADDLIRSEKTKVGK
jgi:hypothetical protein